LASASASATAAEANQSAVLGALGEPEPAGPRVERDTAPVNAQDGRE
jgi:hypothetical protein